MAITSEEVNLLVYRYLIESGTNENAFLLYNRVISLFEWLIAPPT
jgi:hypothetical protein